MDEIKKPMFNMGDNKSLGLDGYNIFFLKKAWEVIGNIFIEGIQSIFEAGLVNPRINAINICLILKTHYPTKINKCKPIPCCISWYQICNDNVGWKSCPLL